MVKGGDDRPGAPPLACPCGLSAPYLVCCGRFHGASAAEPRTPEELMRSRFAAFVKRDVAWLYRSLHPEHVDRGSSLHAFRRDLARHFATGVSYDRLVVLDAPACTALDVGLVLFVAYGREREGEFTLCELSSFVHDGTGWRYRSGQRLTEGDLADPPPRSPIEDLRRRGLVS